MSDLPNDANKKFVEDFKAKYKRVPSFYAAQAYDAANLIASAVEAGKATSARKTISGAAMKQAKFPRCAGRSNTTTTTSRSELLSSGGGGNGRRQLHAEDDRHRAHRASGPLSRQVPDEIAAAFAK